MRPCRPGSNPRRARLFLLQCLAAHVAGGKPGVDFTPRIPRLFGPCLSPNTLWRSQGIARLGWASVPAAVLSSAVVHNGRDSRRRLLIYCHCSCLPHDRGGGAAVAAAREAGRPVPPSIPHFPLQPQPRSQPQPPLPACPSWTRWPPPRTRSSPTTANARRIRPTAYSALRTRLSWSGLRTGRPAPQG